MEERLYRYVVKVGMDSNSEFYLQTNDVDELYAKIKEYTQLIEQGEETKEIRSMRWWIIREARELGLQFEGDNPLN